MSDTELRLIAASDPYWQPTRQQSELAVELLSRSHPNISGRFFDSVHFVDSGGNWEGVYCPSCGSDAGAWWGAAMEAAYAKSFQDLRIVTPCCRASTDLNELIFEPPSGLARYSLAISGPEAFLAPHIVERLEEILGVKLKQVWFHI